MTVDEIESILSSEETIEPSAGFAASVMEAVRRSAAEAPALPFPWPRLAGGMAVSAACALAGGLLALRAEAPLVALPSGLSPLRAAAPELGYAGLALFASVGLARFTKGLARVLVRP